MKLNEMGAGRNMHARSVDPHQAMSQVIHEPGNFKINELTTLLQSPAQKGSRCKYIYLSPDNYGRV